MYSRQQQAFESFQQIQYVVTTRMASLMVNPEGQQGYHKHRIGHHWFKKYDRVEEVQWDHLSVNQIVDQINLVIQISMSPKQIFKIF